VRCTSNGPIHKWILKAVLAISWRITYDWTQREC
jgi:hypothetical protein